MANPKPSTKKLACKITDIKPDPLHQGRMIVAVEFDDGNKKLGPWHQGFAVLPDQIVTVDDFVAQMYKMHIARPVDPFEDLRKAVDVGETFVLNLTAKIEPEPDN